MSVEAIADEAKPLCPVLKRKDWKDTVEQFHLRVTNNLRHYKGQFLNYERGCYRVQEDATVRSVARLFLDNSAVRVALEGGGFQTQAFRPENKHVSELFNALRDNDHISGTLYSPPCWFDEKPRPPAHECISLANGILHLPSLDLFNPTPAFFCLNSLPFEYDENATCPRWEQALREWWPSNADGSDAEEVALLQEIVGYLVSGDNSLHRLFAFVGNGRNGKGVIAAVITMLLGEENVVPTSAAALASDFGQAELIVALAAILPEFGFGPKDDRVRVTNFMKAVSGGDSVQVNRKFLPAYIGKLLLRFIIFCNTIPAFSDDSNALRSRLVVLRMGQVFEGEKRDRGLTEKLRSERAGIFNWAMRGLERLRARGDFLLTESALAERDRFARMASPIRAFLEDRTEVADGAFVSEADLFGAYGAWCVESNASRVSKTKFCEAVEQFEPARVKSFRPKAADGKRERGFRGLRLAAVARGGSDDLPF